MTIDPRLLALAGVRGLQPYQPGKPIEELEREYGVRDAIKLASNENPLGPGLAARAAMERALTEVARYPDGAGTNLKTALAQRLGVTPGQITLGNGSNDILELAARTFVAPGDEVLFSQHAFAVYPIVTQAVGGTAVVTPAREWGYDLDAMRAHLSPRTKLIFIANPNNPTGTWLVPSVLEAFLADVPARTIVVLDEAYIEYMGEDEAPDSVAWLARYPNLVITRTFSKAYGLAGLRVGYGISSAAIADLFNRVRQPFNVNSLAQAAALAALDDHAHLVRARSVNREGMAQLTAAFDRYDLAYIPSVANFLSVHLPRPGLEVYEALLHEGVIARPVANYGMPQHLRITVGLPEENARFLSALQRVLSLA
jgi:histidinol-phosphate aminotransferase